MPDWRLAQAPYNFGYFDWRLTGRPKVKLQRLLRVGLRQILRSSFY
jgi:hypothetical protein